MKNQLLKSVFIRLTKKPWRYSQYAPKKKFKRKPVSPTITKFKYLSFLQEVTL